MSAEISEEFEVALSFAGEERNYVRVVADYLKARGVKVYFDEYNEIEEWGCNLCDRLTNVYQNAKSFAVIFVSESYAKKPFTNLERKSIQTRALQDPGFLLPVRFDDTDIPGLLSTTKHVDARKVEPIKLGQMILRKLGVGLESMIDTLETLDGSIAEEFAKFGYSITRDPTTKYFLLSAIEGADCSPIRYKFRVGSGAEDLEVMSAVNEHQRSGAPLEIPAKYMTEFEAPKELRPLLAPDQLNSFVIEQKFDPSAGLTVRLEFTDDNSQQAIIAGIRIRPRHAGQVEAVFDSFGENSPLRIEIRPRLDSEPMTFKLQYTFSGYVRQAIEHLKFFSLASRGGVFRLINDETDHELAHSRVNGGAFNAPPAELTDILDMLMDIQREFHVQFDLPAGFLEGQTVCFIRRIHNIIREGVEVAGIASIYWPYDQEEHEKMTEVVKSKPFKVGTQSADAEVSIFGISLALGACCLVIDPAEASIRTVDGEEVLAMFPIEGSQALSYYPKWYRGDVDLPLSEFAC